MKRQNEDGASTPKAKRGRPKVSCILTRYPPVRDTGDDDITVDRNILQLTKELQKEKPRREVVLSLAQQTYTSRRQETLSDSHDITVTTLVQEYGALKKSYVVCIIIMLLLASFTDM